MLWIVVLLCLSTTRPTNAYELEWWGGNLPFKGLEPMTKVLLPREAMSEFHDHNFRLYEHLMANYTKALPPYYTRHESTFVPEELRRIYKSRMAMRLIYFRLVNLEQAQQIMKMLMDLRLFWEDTRLAWDPREFGGIDHIYLGTDTIWTPTVRVLNSVQVSATMPKSDSVLVNYTGACLWEMGFVTSSICEMTTYYFPFDMQTCTVCLMDEIFPMREQWIAGALTQQVLQHISSSGNGEWDVECVESVEYLHYNHVVLRSKRDVKEGHCYSFYLRRNSKFYVMVIIIPTFVITALSITGIFAKRIKGDDFIGELSLGLTSMMTITVMLGIVAETLPKTASLPVLSIFLTIDVLLLALCVLIAIMYPRVLFRRKLKISTEANRKHGIWMRLCAPNVVFLILLHVVNVVNLLLILRHYIFPPMMYSRSCGKRMMERYNWNKFETSGVSKLGGNV